MKAVCIMLSYVLSGNGGTYQEMSEKKFDSLDECRRWMYQAEFIGPQPGAILIFRTCVEELING